MEYVDGASLDAFLKTGLLPVPAIVQVVTEVLRGLGYAHEVSISEEGIRGLVHRDVSPHNVLLAMDGAVKVSDFGIAKARITSNATGSDMIKGKPAYMSPEQANGDPLDGRSDLFAVGVMLWEMLCGRPLFLGASIQETLSRVLFAPIVSPRALRPELPADLEHVTMRLLARDRGHRYQDTNAAIVDLIACRNHPRSGRELLRGLMRARLSSEVEVVASGARTALDSRRPIPAPIDGRSRPPTVGPQPTKTRASLWMLIVAVGVLGVTLGLFVASRVTPQGPVLAPPAAGSNLVDGTVAVAAVVPDASQQRNASVPIDAAALDTQAAETGGPRPKRGPSEAVASKPEPEPSTRELDRARITKAGALFDVYASWRDVQDTEDVRRYQRAVAQYWLGKASRFQSCYVANFREYRATTDELIYWPANVHVNYTVDSKGIVTNTSQSGTMYGDCIDKVVADSTGRPAPSSGSAKLVVTIFMNSCLYPWELDDKQGEPRTPCPYTKMRN